MMNRRIFIKQSALAGAAVLFAPSLASAKPKRCIGLQLYTLRNQIGADVKGVISKVAAAGYHSVETYGFSNSRFWGMDPKSFAALLKDHNMVSPSGHYDFEPFFDGKEERLRSYIDAANTLGQEYVTVPHLSVKLRKDYKKIAEGLNRAGEICRQGGVKLAYHNHDFEFEKQEQNITGYDILLKDTDQDLVKFELDLYWAVRAGHSPGELFKQHPGRFPLWHVKDMDKEKPTRNTEIGNGSLDFKGIFNHAKLAGLRHFFVEQENNYVPNEMGSITSSFNYIKKSIL